MGELPHCVDAMNETNSLADRFWKKVIKSDGCWKWTGAKHKFGYGMIRLGGVQPKITASRAAWLIHFGDIPSGMYVCHRCDNPECTNPEHLFLGTASDNAVDKESKGRGLRRLPQSDCNVISTLFHAGVSKRLLARAFGVERSVIETALKHGVTRPKASKPARPQKQKSHPPIGTGSKNGHAKLAESDVLAIRTLHASGISYRDLSDQFGVGRSMIGHIVNRRNWSHI